VLATTPVQAKDPGAVASPGSFDFDRRSGFVGVQPVLHFGPEFLTLLVNALIDLAAIVPIGYDRIDRPEHDKYRDKKRKGSHGVRSLLPLRQRNNRVTRTRVPYDGLETQLEPGISRRS
jgi:hypothetical protein